MIISYLRAGFTGLLCREHHPACLGPPIHRCFTACSRQANKSLPPRPTLPDTDLHHVYLKGSGPGGQKINKTNSAVQLTHIPTGTVIKSQATRSRSQNYKIARQILAEKIEHLEKGDESRLAKKVEKKSTQKRSREKKARRKYRALEEGKNGVVEEEDRGEPASYRESGRGESGDSIAGYAENHSQVREKTKEDNVRP